MSTSIPNSRRQSVQWSLPPVPPVQPEDAGSPSKSPRRYREYPTPHPRMLAEVASYLTDNETASAVAASKADEPAHPDLRREGPGPPPKDDGQPPGSGSFRATPHTRTRPTNPDFLDALPAGRSLSQVEEGGQTRRDRRNEGGPSVVAELVKFGLKHGIARGLKSSTKRVRRSSVKYASTSTLYKRDPKADEEEKEKEEKKAASVRGRRMSYTERVKVMRERRHSQIIHHVEDYVARQKFLIRLAKALLSFGAPSHRIESQLASASEILDVNVGFVHLPNLIMASFMDSGTRTSETHFVRAGGRVALTKLHSVHAVYRDVLHDKCGATEGSERLKAILLEKPIYPIWVRCLLAFLCASIICVLSFGGSIIDMFISGLSASLLQYLGLNAAAKSTIYANVYEISVSIIVSFLARALGTLKGNLFCYSSISSAGVVLILPGFTILIAALELTSRNILCGSVRMVYAIIYTLFLGFGLTIGSDLYLVVNPHARDNLAAMNMLGSEVLHGFLTDTNTTSVPLNADMGGTFTFLETAASANSNFIKGCYRDPSWPWYRQPFPWWTMLILVPLYSTCSSIQNLQSIRSIQLPIMVAFSCAAFTANRVANHFISDRGDIVSAFGAFVIGICGNTYSRLVGGTAFTSMVTGVLFLVPSAIGNGGGLVSSYNSSEERYSSSFGLGIRMIQVAIGVTIGLFVAQILVYALGRRKSVAHFAF